MWILQVGIIVASLVSGFHGYPIGQNETTLQKFGLSDVTLPKSYSRIFGPPNGYVVNHYGGSGNDLKQVCK